MMLNTEQQEQVERTEHLMNIVVEMRKRHGAACVQRAQKSSLAEHQLFQLTLDSICKSNFKTKTSVPDINVDQMMEDLKTFDSELDAYCRRTEKLQRSVMNTKTVVQQLKRANPVLGARQQLTANVLLARAKNKNRY